MTQPRIQYFRPSALAVGVLTALTSIGMPALANDSQDDTTTSETAASPSTDLGTLTVTLKKRLHKKSEESTGLGKTIKTADDINNQQILSLKDLVGDIAGVAVVEQGRGASSGFTIRGMDKNRVAVSVDGISQIQSYLVQKRQYGDGREGSGAINEIEIENISGMQISQGASGSESGSGALGGAVSFRTKGVDDVLEAGKPFGIRHKSSYASRDKQWLHSLALGAKAGNFDVFLQYTDRTKEASKPHDDIYNTRYHVWRWAGSDQDFKDGKIAPDSDPKRTFVIIDECPSYNPKDVNSVLACAKPKLRLTPTLETLNAENYTGDKRVIGDPMDYHSSSFLAKLGYAIGSRHRLEGVFERTTQVYNTQDMTKPAYHLTPERGNGNLAQSYLVYRGQNYSEGFRTDAHIGLWTQTQFFDERHDKGRIGLSYRYQDPTKTGPIDEATFSFDRQTVTINHLQMEKYCSPYPIVDKHCKAGFDKPNSAEHQNQKRYTETHNLVRANFGKFLQGDVLRHRINGELGIDGFSSNLWIGNATETYYHLDFQEDTYFANPKGGFIDVYRANTRFETLNACQDNSKYVGEARKCGDRLITGYNAYASLKSTSYLGSFADLSLGVRYDKHRFDSDDSWTGTGSYTNTSWHTGLVIKPTDYLDIAYRASSGYRVPSFKELFGYRLDGLVKGVDDNAHYRTNVKPEQALNQELGISLKGDIGNLDLSYFDNRYKDLIDLTLKSADVNGQPTLQWGYRNYQDVGLSGVSVGGKVYLGSLSDKFAAGLVGRFSYLKTTVKQNSIKEGFYWGSGYFLDTISPTRYVLGLDYTNDDETWGAGATWTITDPKDSQELITVVATPDGKGYEKKATPISSSGWNTLDLSAFYRPSPHLTLRASINNALNYRYSPWEAIRQTSVVAGNAHTQGLPSQYAAAGRNVVVSVETKF